MPDILKHLIVVSISLSLLPNAVISRQLTYSLNPDCPQEIRNRCSANDTNLVYVQSRGDTDLIHYVWASIRCIPPSLMIIKTSLQSKLSINWEHLSPQCPEDIELRNLVQINGTIDNSIDFQMSRLFLFSDVNKTGSFDPLDVVHEVKWDGSNQFVWDRVKENKKSSDCIQLTFSNVRHEDSTLRETDITGSVSFDLRIDGSDGRADDLPHLAFTQSSASLQLTIDDIISQANDTTFPNARPMAVIDVRTDKSVSEPQFEEAISIDDEYTPGVFKQYTLPLKSNETKADEEKSKSYVYWKPIAYNANEKISANTFDVVHSLDRSDNSSKSWKTFSLTFGAADDPTYYNDKKYTTFSIVVGIGSAPTDELSLLVKMVIVVGFGLPGLIIAISAVYIVVRKVKNRNANNLLLSQSNQSLDQSRE